MFPFEPSHAPSELWKRSSDYIITSHALKAPNCGTWGSGRRVAARHKVDRKSSFLLQFFHLNQHIFWLWCFYYFCPWFALGSIAKYRRDFLWKAAMHIEWAVYSRAVHVSVFLEKPTKTIANYLMGYNVDFVQYFGFRSSTAINQQ